MRPVVMLALAASLSACGSGTDPLTNELFAPELGIDLSQMVQTASGLHYLDLVVGTGSAAIGGASVTVHYEGWLADGTKFDSSRERGQPFVFTVGARQVIAGWDEGVVGMRIGGTRRLVIPSELAYGERGVGPIPPNAALVFDIELLSIQLP